jgi:hypothetical protein
MKKNVLYIALAMCLASFSIALHGQTDNRQRFDKQEFITRHNAYITVEIGLTSAEAVEFIPLENQMKEKLFEIGHECRKLNRETRLQKSISDELYLKIINCNIESHLKEVQLTKEYYEKFKKIISPEKLYKYQQAEFKFMHEFMGNNNQDNRRSSRNNANEREKRQNSAREDI